MKRKRLGTKKYPNMDLEAWLVTFQAWVRMGFWKPYCMVKGHKSFKEKWSRTVIGPIIDTAKDDWCDRCLAELPCEK